MTDPSAQAVKTQSSTTGYTVQVLTDWPALAAIADEWEDLHARVGGYLFTSFDWLAAQQAAFGQTDRLHVVTLWKQGRLAAAAPLIETRQPVSKLAPRYRPATLATWQCDYTGFNEFLAEDAEAFDAIVIHLATRSDGRVINLELLTEDTKREHIEALFRRHGHVTRSYPQFVSTIMAAAHGWDAYLETRSRSFRKTLRKGDRALEEAGATLLVFDAPNGEILARTFDISQRSWKQKAGTGMAATHAHRVFATEIWTRFAARGDAFIAVLSTEACDFAFCFCVRLRGTWYGIWAEFDESFSHLSPGRTIIARSLQELFNRGPVARFDCMRKTHFTEVFGSSDYDITGLRAVPARSAARLLGDGEVFLRRLLAGRRLTGRKSWRRGDVIPPKEG